MKEISLEALAILVRAFIESIGEDSKCLGSSGVFTNKNGNKMILYEDIKNHKHTFYLQCYDESTIQMMQLELINGSNIPAEEFEECVALCEKIGPESVITKKVGDPDVVS